MDNGALAFALRSQLLASLLMLKDCIDRCPQEEWHERHGDYPFSQVAFHTLFDCDMNLSEDEEGLKRQEIHVAHREEFGAYEELEGRSADRLYGREFILEYHAHCLDKAKTVLGGQANDSLSIPNADFYKSMTRAERYLNCARHTQHHAAQLGLRLQLLSSKEMEWIGRCHGE